MFINKFNAFNIEPLLKIVVRSDNFKNEKIMANFDAGKFNRKTTLTICTMRLIHKLQQQVEKIRYQMY